MHQDSLQQMLPFHDALIFCLVSKAIDQFRCSVYEACTDRPIIKIYKDVHAYGQDCKAHKAPKADIFCKCDVNMVFDPAYYHNACIDENGFLCELTRLDGNNVDLIISIADEVVHELKYRDGFWQWFGIPGYVWDLVPYAALGLCCGFLAAKVF